LAVACWGVIEQRAADGRGASDVSFAFLASVPGPTAPDGRRSELAAELWVDDRGPHIGSASVRWLVWSGTALHLGGRAERADGEYVFRLDIIRGDRDNPPHASLSRYVAEARPGVDPPLDRVAGYLRRAVLQLQSIGDIAARLGVASR
jgi:hypothetical protein